METIQNQLVNSKNAQKSISILNNQEKSDILVDLSDLITARVSDILRENDKDLHLMDATNPKRDRLLLNADRIADLAKSLVDVSKLEDPSNQLLLVRNLANGLHIEKRTVPLGVVGIIYESRPNVTIDVAALCIKSGNVCLLRGGQDAFYTNQYLVSLIRQVLETHKLDPNIIQLLPADRKYIHEMLIAERFIDVIIPRGSNELISYVRQNARVPVIETGAGVCHTYVEKSAILDDAASVVANAKISRPSVCNALDTILIDQEILEPFLQRLAPLFAPHSIEMFVDDEVGLILKKLGYKFISPVSAEDYGREFLDLKCSVKVVSSPYDALTHIARYSSKHSEAILTKNHEIAELFLNQVDAAAVYLNASTRFTDGQVFGLGAEIGISTQKLHARGPFALEKLVTEKWIIKGEGQTR